MDCLIYFCVNVVFLMSLIEISQNLFRERDKERKKKKKKNCILYDLRGNFQQLYFFFMRDCFKAQNKKN